MFSWFFGDGTEEDDDADKATDQPSGQRESSSFATSGSKSGQDKSETPTASVVGSAAVEISDVVDDVDEDGSGGKYGEEDVDVALPTSDRLKGYITFVIASAINFYAALESDLSGGLGVIFTHHEKENAFGLIVPATDQQIKYAMAVSIVTILISCWCIVVHFDRFTCLQKTWIKAFRPGSMIELVILLFLLIWWSIAVGINTSTSGAAGPGKGQYNLYFSTWVNLWTAIWMVDRWINAAGWSSFKTFMDSWPNRAVSSFQESATFFSSFGTMLFPFLPENRIYRNF